MYAKPMVLFICFLFVCWRELIEELSRLKICMGLSGEQEQVGVSNGIYIVF